jgi:nitrogen PTS system EIIA component
MTLTVRDAAQLLDVSQKTIYRWIKLGSIPAYRINEQYRFNRAELLAWSTARRIPLSPEIMLEHESSGAPLPTLTEALRLGGISYRIGGTDKATVLQSVVETMRLPDEVDRRFLYDVLLARESLGSTAVGEGIAIPHVRNPVVLHVNRPMITLSFLEHPIEFGALDGQPVSVLFTLVSPTVRAHLHMISRLGFVLRDPAFKNDLKQQATRDILLSSLAHAESLLHSGHPPGASPS